VKAGGVTVIVLDTGALEVFADPSADARATQLVRDLLALAARTGTPVRVPILLPRTSERVPVIQQ
jgi:hypothetical protein